MNPKDLAGQKKTHLYLIPPVALIHEAHAMEGGAAEYGPYNWRDEKILASEYISATQRHLLQWWDGEELSRDRLAHHLGHARATLGIILDAQNRGCLIDDRHSPGGAAELLDATAIVKRILRDRG